MERRWLFDRCREVQQQPDGMIDLWAREHYKSTIITYGKTIQDILRSHGDEPHTDKEYTVGIFSHTRPIAKKFLRQIQLELETNDLLKSWFPEILYQDPKREAPLWSLDSGIVVRRRTNPKEATVEAWGLVDSQPTAAHFNILVYDDVVTKDSVTSPEMIHKTTEALELSYNLGAHGGVRRFIGTRYHFNDTYREVMNRGTAFPRLYPATDDGTPNGRPVFLDRETLVTKRRDMGPYTFACQMLQDPKADERQGFRREWLRYYVNNHAADMALYIIVDPAGEKKKLNDYTAMGVIGLSADRNYYLLDGIYDRLNLRERTMALMYLHRKWHPISRIQAVGYEKYGKDSDIEHIEEVQEDKNYRFEITELGGSLAKNDRIRRLVPIFEQGRFWLPETLVRENYEGKNIDIIKTFVEEEYIPFPVAGHDDFFDMMSRIVDDDLGASWPSTMTEEEVKASQRYALKGHSSRRRSWRSF